MMAEASASKSNNDLAEELSVFSVADSDGAEDNGFATQLANKEVQKKTLGRKETKAVSTVRVVIVFVLLLAALAVCLMVYFYLRSDEKEDFEIEYNDYAKKVIDSYSFSIEHQLRMLDSFGVAMTSHAKTTGAAFPFVIIPDFAIRSASTRVQMESTRLGYEPIVTEDNRKMWESFAAEHKDWVLNESKTELSFRKRQDLAFGAEVNYTVEIETPHNDKIYYILENRSKVISPEGTGPYVPSWQFSPVSKDMQGDINMDLTTHPHFMEVLDRAMVTQKAIFNKVKYVFNSSLYTAHYLTKGQYRFEKLEHVGDPTSNLLYPVFDDFGDNKTLSGWIFVNIYFKLFFSKILPLKARGIHCVLENTLNQTFTYQIDGSDVCFLGEGDLHDAHYDHMALTQDINEFLQQRKGTNTVSRTVSDLDDEYCKYRLRIYPSASTEAAFVSKKPSLSAIIVGFVFVVTSLVFVLYDILVERRQTIVLDHAAASGAILSSLFPENVEKRLMEETDAANQSRASNEADYDKDKNVKGGLSDHDQQAIQAIHEMRSKQIAELYPAATILFADLVGFTAWCAQRTPQDVFVLLETVYKAFDKIAEKRGVYKMETVGDCYVAVTGLPNPQEDHAVRMVKFALACLNKMTDVKQRLVKAALGEDTAELQIRVGLHSGAVAGGVLRGRKSRFQLFGDAMNTASRMESSGVKGRIHISQATADELAAQGKSHWLTPREDKITAMGKGEMQTYFVDIHEKERAGSSFWFSSLDFASD